MRTYKILFFILTLFYVTTFDMLAQQTKNVSEMTKEEMMTLTYDDLLHMSFEDLITAANRFGMSADELLEYFLNKDVTSASKRAEKSLNSPLSSTVLSQQEIENSGATCIPEVLRLVPGVIVREKTRGNYDVQIRGNENLPPKGMFVYSENAITLVMIDGRPVYNYAFGGTFWETLGIEIADIERIEVIRGPSSALYGPNAVSGAISIFTKKVEDKKLHVNGHVQYGTNNALLGDVAVSKGLGDKLKVRVSANATKLNRFDDEFYVFDYDSMFTKEDLSTLVLPGDNELAEYGVMDRYSDSELATDKYGVNAFLNYMPTKEISLDLATGIQSSETVQNPLGNHDTPLVPRTSSTSYVDLRAAGYGFQFQTNYMVGDQDVQKDVDGWHIKPEVFNANLEYEKAFGTLILRPGVSYQTTTYDDSEWGNAELRDGFLNGPKTITSFSGSLRADYKLFEKLRLIGAIRADKYNNPEDIYTSYQFITSYDLNKNNVVRAVYSRANRGPFISDTYADYDWPLQPGLNLHYEGNKDLNLPTMDMVELGYRSKITKRIMLDVEAFYTQMNNIIFWTPYQFTLYADLSPMMLGQNPTIQKATGHGQYQNADMTSYQAGITANISVVLSEKINFKVFGTYQQSRLTDVYSRTIWDDFNTLRNSSTNQLMSDVGKIKGGDFSPLADPTKEYSSSINFRDYPTEDVDNESTPSFYGGASVDYNPTKKWNINSSFYYYSSNELIHNKINDLGRAKDQYLLPNGSMDPNYVNNGRYTDMYTIDPKLIMNLKVSYKFYKDHAVFFNGRNFLNSQSREFGYMDEVHGTYLLGVNFNF